MGSGPIWGAVITLGIFFAFQTYLVQKARQKAKKLKEKDKVKLMDLIVTSEDGRYSISRLQMYLWTLAGLSGFGAVVMYHYEFKIPDIPQSLYMLMGVNLAASVASTAINTAKNETITKGRPDFWRDIFFESEDSLDLPRTQMFVWTIVSLCVFFVLLYKSLLAGNPSMPDIPTGLIVLMGVSQGAYLGTKAAAKKTDETPPKKGGHE
jgi:Na+/melibiose symporter-like transporter